MLKPAEEEEDDVDVHDGAGDDDDGGGDGGDDGAAPDDDDDDQGDGDGDGEDHMVMTVIMTACPDTSADVWGCRELLRRMEERLRGLSAIQRGQQAGRGCHGPSRAAERPQPQREHPTKAPRQLPFCPHSFMLFLPAVSLIES